jgi:hypothetical protein
MQLSKLSEQIKIRDEMIVNARRRLQNEAGEIDDPRVIVVEDLVN